MPVRVGLFRFKKKKKEKTVSGTEEIVLYHPDASLPHASELSKCVGIYADRTGLLWMEFRGKILA